MECEAAAESEQGRHFRELLASECAKAEERGHSQGMALGLAEGRKDGREEAIWQLRAGTEEERQRFAERTEALLRTLDEDRDRYIHRLEQESARLALAVAARILRREAEADPLLLTGAVRVALGQLAASTVVRLRVPAADLSLWTETLANIPNLHIRPELIADSRMGLGECRLETELGSADLGLTGQLEVLEHRFFDRDRPESKEGLAEEAMRPDAGTVPSPAPPKGAAR
jgi:flagellar assembly protein FliH